VILGWWCWSQPFAPGHQAREPLSRKAPPLDRPLLALQISRNALDLGGFG
jgi:hypothetical protein